MKPYFMALLGFGSAITAIWLIVRAIANDSVKSRFVDETRKAAGCRYNYGCLEASEAAQVMKAIEKGVRNGD